MGEDKAFGLHKRLLSDSGCICVLEKIYIFNLVADPAATHPSGSPAMGFWQVVCFHLTLIKTPTPLLKVKCIPNLDPARTGLAKRCHFKYVFEKNVVCICFLVRKALEVREEMTKMELETEWTLMHSGQIEDP